MVDSRANDIGTSTDFAAENVQGRGPGASVSNLAKNSLLPSKPWVPECQRLTNREALEILERKQGERREKVAAGIPVSNLTKQQSDIVQRVINSLTSGPHRVFSSTKEEEQALVKAIISVGGDQLEKVSLQDILNYYRPKGLSEGEQFFQKEFQEGKITSEVVESIVSVLKEKRAERGVDKLEEEDTDEDIDEDAGLKSVASNRE